MSWILLFCWPISLTLRSDCIWIFLLPFEAVVVLYCQNQIVHDNHIFMENKLHNSLFASEIFWMLYNVPCYCFIIFDTLKTVLRSLWMTKRMFFSCYRLILPLNLRVNTIGHFLFLNHAMNALIPTYTYMVCPDKWYIPPSTNTTYHRP